MMKFYQKLPIMSKNKIQNSDSLIDSLGIETEKLITNENEDQ